MKSMSAKDAKNGFGQLLDTAQREPVTIEKKGRPVAVVISLDEYEKLEAARDAYWAAQAKKAASGGRLSKKESEKLLSDLLNAED
jgi:prevent-host-death family protein